MSGNLILPHQRGAFDDLLATARAYFSGDWRSLPIKPRWARLLVAPTGTGKSHLVRSVAAACRAEFFSVSFGSWIPTGCTRAQGRQTVQSLIEVLANSERTVLMIDEIDKLNEETSWTTYLRAELYAILDGKWPAGAKFGTDEDQDDDFEKMALVHRRLRFGCWIVGVGTWQALWEQRLTQCIGFHEHARSMTPLARDELVRTIPRETLGRFASSIVTIRSMAEADYHAALVAAARELPEELRDRFYERATNHIPSAIENQTGCRFLEETISEILIEAAAHDRHHDEIELV